MSYFIDLFSPETYEAFSRSSRDISGFRRRHRGMAERIKAGDVFVCYVTRLSRWFGLGIDKALPIHDDMIWKGLSFTRNLERGSISWTGRVRGSLVRLEDSEGKFLFRN